LSHLCFRLGLIVTLAASAIYAGSSVERPQQVTRVVKADPRTGKLVRSVVVTSRPVATRTIVAQAAAAQSTAEAVVEAAPLPTNFDEVLEQIAAENALSPILMRSVIKVESNYNPFAVSSKGAMGLMQLMPETARRFSVADVFNPIDNMKGGAKYLRFLLDLFNGDNRLAVAAYNAGEKAIAKYGDVPPYPETQMYVFLVAREIEAAQKAAAVIAAAAAAKPAAAKPETKPAEPHIQEIVDSAGVVHFVAK
jgi:hypothetical protein